MEAVVQIIVNGESVAIARMAVLHYLESLSIEPQRVAVELNRTIVQRQTWDQAIVGPGATLEIVQFVGGG